MSVYYSLDSSPPSMLASNSGWGAFLDWAETFDPKEYLVLLQLVTYGWTEQLPELTKQLRRALKESPPADDTLDVGKELLSAVLRRGEATVLTINTGMVPSTEPELMDDLERFCQSGVNKGKPGVCPEFEGKKEGVLKRSGKVGHIARLAKVQEHRVLAKVTERVPPSMRKAAGLAVKAVFSTWIPAQHAAHAVATEIGGERHAKKVGRLLLAADLAGAKTVAPAIGALAGPAAGGVAYMMPLASTAYLAYAGVRHPRAVLRAAKGAIGKVRAKFGKAPVKSAEAPHWPKAAIAKLLEGFERAGEDGDFYEALVHVALDETRGDLAEAVQLADAALAEHVAKHAEELPVPHVRQQKPYTCGPASLKAVASLFGKDASEEELADMLGAEPQDGTQPEEMVAGVQHLGLRAEAQEGMTLEQVQRALRNGQPVIVCLQAYGSTDEQDEDKAGHWVVIKGFKGGQFVLVDPSAADGEPVRLTPQELLERWHDQSPDGKTWRRFGVIVSR